MTSTLLSYTKYGYCKQTRKRHTTRSNNALTSQLSKLAGVGAGVGGGVGAGVAEADTDPTAFIADFQKPFCVTF